MKPIEEFKTQEELNECLNWWQSKLFLDSWVIEAKMVDKIIDLDGSAADYAVGYNTFVYESELSNIQILQKEKFNGMGKYCAEHILTHELLHCKYNWMEPEGGSYESAYLVKTEHKLLEQMAKSLIMAKYDLGFDYFKSGNAESKETDFEDLTPDWAKSSKLDVGLEKAPDDLFQVFDGYGTLLLNKRMVDEALRRGISSECASEETYFENRRKACAERRKKMSNRECFGY